MRANLHFSQKPANFFELVRLVSARHGYSTRRTKNNEAAVKTLNTEELKTILNANTFKLGEKIDPIDLVEYINFRAEVLNTKVSPSLMDRDKAKALYLSEKIKKDPKTRPIMNKQKNEKRHESHRACLVQIQAASIVGFGNFVNDPQQLAYIK